MLNDRRQRVLKLLLTATGALTARELGRALGAPPRAVRYDLQSIGDWVAPFGARLVGTAGIGYHLEGDRDRVQAECDRLRRSDTPTYEYVLSPKERVRRMLLHLLGDDQHHPLQVLADRLGVAKSTIHSDVGALESWTTARGLALERTHAGMRLTGPEPLRRQAMVDLVFELADEGQLATLVDGAPESRSLLALLAPILSGVDWVSLGAAAHQAGSPELVVYLAVMVSRAAAGHLLLFASGHAARLLSTPQWRAARELADRVQACSGLVFPPGEVANLALVMEGVRTGVDCDGGLTEASLAMARALAGLIQTRLGVPLIHDQEFVMGLALHLKPVQHRLERGLAVENPLLDEVCAKYPMALRVAQDVAAVLEATWHTLVPPAEIGYIAIHIAAAIERAKLQQAHGFRALVVCGAGIGTAQLLATRLRALTPEIHVGRITSALRVREVLAAEPYDLVISTAQIGPCPLPVVRVSPLLTEDDVIHLRQALDQLQNRAGRGREPMLKDVLTRELIALDVEAGDWEAAVRAAGALLVADGAAEERYVDAMIRTCKELGPYIVLGPGFALPHARPEEGVKRIAIAMVRLRQPVAFGNPDNDPVDLIFALGAVDHETHLKALMQLSELLGNPESVAAMRTAATADEVLGLVESVSMVCSHD